VLGGATGKGAHILICDDLMKNRQDAESETIRDRTWDALTDDLLSRLEPGGAVVLMATRWHQDDPTGRMLKLIENSANCNGPVKRLRLTALPETDEDREADRAAGIERDETGALWPARYPIHILEAIRERSGPYTWSSLYQQRPTPAEGGIFKRAWFEPVVPQTPEIQYAVRFWDMAMSAKTSADYTVGLKLGFASDGHWYNLDVARGQIEWGDVTEFMANVMLRDGPSVQQGIEAKGYMSRAVQDLNADPRLHGFVIRGYPVDTDKLTRALPVAAKLAAGLVHTVVGHWNTAFIEEVCAFPNGAHDDQIDALSGAWAMCVVMTGEGEVYFADEETYGIGVY
jgi:predicted phage terminase large subunit-like protein